MRLVLVKIKKYIFGAKDNNEFQRGYAHGCREVSLMMRDFPEVEDQEVMLEFLYSMCRDNTDWQRGMRKGIADMAANMTGKADVEGTGAD